MDVNIVALGLQFLSKQAIPLFVSLRFYVFELQNGRLETTIMKKT
jgi:hypothetical protein